MAARPHVAEVHDLHIWEITTEMPAASAHVLVEPRQDCHAVRADLEDLLSREYGISHLTLQVDHYPDAGPGSAPVRAAEPAGSIEDGGATANSLAAEDDHGHGAGDLHCEDAHGPTYRPARDR